MLYTLLAKRRVFWASIRVLEQRFWYASLVNCKYACAKFVFSGVVDCCSVANAGCWAKYSNQFFSI